MTADNEILTPDAAAELLGVLPSRLASWRRKRIGPPFVRAGRTVRYSAALLRRWQDANSELLTPSAAAEFLAIPLGRLAGWRRETIWSGKLVGPPFAKGARAVKYSTAMLRRWKAGRTLRCLIVLRRLRWSRAHRRLGRALARKLQAGCSRPWSGYPLAELIWWRTKVTTAARGWPDCPLSTDRIARPPTRLHGQLPPPTRSPGRLPPQSRKCLAVIERLEREASDGDARRRKRRK